MVTRTRHPSNHAYILLFCRTHEEAAGMNPKNLKTAAQIRHLNGCFDQPHSSGVSLKLTNTQNDKNSLTKTPPQTLKNTDTPQTFTPVGIISADCR